MAVAGDGRRIYNTAYAPDVARGIFLAMERGARCGDYILGGENRSLQEVWEIAGRAVGRRSPRLRVPARLAPLVAVTDEWLEGRVLGREPILPRGLARLAEPDAAPDRPGR